MRKLAMFVVCVAVAIDVIRWAATTDVTNIPAEDIIDEVTGFRVTAVG